MKTFLYIISVIQAVSALIIIFTIENPWIVLTGVFITSIGLFISTLLLDRQIKLEDYNKKNL